MPALTNNLHWQPLLKRARNYLQQGFTYTLNIFKLIATLKKYIKQQMSASSIQDRGVVEAYDIWAENYDSQPGNLMLDLDELVFSELLTNTPIKDKQVADIGCGTGRHWNRIFGEAPATLTGFDVSPGMLDKLVIKFPMAKTQVIADNKFAAIADGLYDVIVSTLTVAHIENLEEALAAWCRILKPKGELIITDFHPNALASGGKRTFKHGKGHIAVQNFVHTTESIKAILLKNGFELIAEVEKKGR